jgi:hypothetical protein
MRRHSKIFVGLSILVVAIAFGLTVSRTSLPEIEHDPYIWQRSWKKPLMDPIRKYLNNYNEYSQLLPWHLCDGIKPSLKSSLS